ncbi:hypothetical protein F4859DRAFT_527711 [Xylaria cf. heliscus]|nr:hypothetical protein F4859DRAFT_527711 [Xylaria cf. heliscus]
MAEKAYEDMQAKAIVQIGNVSKLLREAIAASLPVAPEQYLTIAIPGTTIDVREIRDGGTFVYDAEKTPFAPIQVQQAEAKLVDNMVPLAHVMIGNTGKSVSRSYDRALDVLVARKATVPGTQGNIRNPDDPEYKNAMDYLTTKQKDTNKTPVEIYIEKQRDWAEAQEAWDRAKIQAKQDAIISNPGDNIAAKSQYDQWNQANYRKFKFAVQGRYIDWVTNGNKYEVETRFAIESIRNTIIVDDDGTNEVNMVYLTPKNWAGLCKQKTEGWFEKNGEYSLDQLNGEIRRLQRLLVSYQALKSAMDIDSADPKPKYPIESSEDTKAPDTTQSDTDLQKTYTELYAAEAKMNLLNQKIRNAKKEEDRKAIRDSDDYKKAVTDLKAKRIELAKAISSNKELHSQATKYALAHLTGDNMKIGVQAWLNRTIADLEKNIQALQLKRADKADLFDRVPVIEGADDENPDAPDESAGTIVVPPGGEEPSPRFGVGRKVETPGGSSKNLPEAGTVSDPWVEISASFSATDQQSEEKQSSFGFSVGGSVGWGLWSAGGSYARSSTKSDATSDMASCDVSVSFQALVVNIGRPWLYGELFSDAELDVAKGIHLSPGPQKLHELMLAQKSDSGVASGSAITQLAKYGLFPAYPTSFIVAADTTIEFHGDTQHIEQHFSSSSSSSSSSVGWGPWAVKSSFSKSDMHQSFQMQSTATGCRLSFGAPQIIGWVSQILPALPRLEGFEPMRRRATREPIAGAHASSSSADSPASWDAISDEWSNPDTAQSQDAASMDPMMTEYMSYIRTSLDHLARISLFIRRAGNMFRFERVDVELDERTFEELWNYLSSIILKAFPNPKAHNLSIEKNIRRVSDYGALTSTQKRLVHANILRRHRVEWATKYQKKGACPVPEGIRLNKDPHQLSESHAPITSSIAGIQTLRRIVN